MTKIVKNRGKLTKGIHEFFGEKFPQDENRRYIKNFAERNSSSPSEGEGWRV